jgi:DNA-binding winged helix-turn-helix (wHTH) protein
VGQRIARALKERFSKESVGVTQSANGPFHLVIDDRRPGVVVIGDTQVRLPERPYRLIRLLAERPQECVTYDEIYAALWGADVFVENNQMHQHKSEILRRTRDVMPEDFELIRTIPKRGFVLTVPPEMVRVIRIAPSEVSTGSAS